MRKLRHDRNAEMHPQLARSSGRLQRLRNGPHMKSFWAKVRKTRFCWLWIAGKDKGGYGQFTPPGGKNMGAHRLAFQLAGGKLPKGRKTVIDHKCGNPSCVRPSHLRCVTQRENVRSGRQRILPPKDVLRIFRMRKRGCTQTEIAKFFSVNQSQISRILSGKRCKNLCQI